MSPVGQWQIDFKELVEDIVSDRPGHHGPHLLQQAAAGIYGWVSRDDLLGTRVEDTSLITT